MRAAPIALAATLALAAAGASAERMMPGLWQIESTMISPALPGVGPATRTQCYGPEQEWDPASMLDPARGHPDCTLTVTSMRPDDFSWTLECPQSGIRGTGQMRYGPTSMQGRVQTETAIAGQRFATVREISARRLGRCGQ